MCLSRGDFSGGSSHQGMENTPGGNSNNNNNSSSISHSFSSPRSSPPGPANLSSSSPVSPPPSLVPHSSAAAMSMASMASMLGSSVAAGLPHSPFGFPPGYPGVVREDFHHVHPGHHLGKFGGGSFGGPESPPPPPSSGNDPSANECKIVEYRGEKIAAFTINGKTMLCLPQAFELFLKHLVGGLHTVYTKLKRLEITPVVCNVEQVRILRGLGAIQPGVNRCKLLGDTEFDSLYKDCTTSRGKIGDSRPGRPPKRGVPFPSMSPQDAMLHLKNSMHNGSDLYKDAGSGGPYVKEARLDKTGGFASGFPPHGTPPGINPAMAAQFMALNHPAAFLSGGLPPFPGLPASSSSPNLSSSSPSPASGNNIRSPGDHHHHHGSPLLKNSGLSSLEALQRSGLLGAAYFERMREGQKSLLQEDERRKARESSIDSVGKDTGDRTAESPVLNLSSKSSGGERGGTLEASRGGGKDLDASSDISGGSDRRFDDEEMPSDPESERQGPKEVHRLRSSLETKDGEDDKVNNNNSSVPEGLPPQLSALSSLANLGGMMSEPGSGQLNSVYGLIGNIQALLKVAVENAKQEERHLLSQKSELKSELLKEKESQSVLYKELQELKRNTAVYIRRFKKEKKFRRRLQEQLQQETKRRVQMEDALRATSAETLKRITESLQKEMEDVSGVNNNVKSQHSEDEEEEEEEDSDDRESSTNSLPGGTSSNNNNNTPTSTAAGGAREDSSVGTQQFQFAAAAAAAAAAAVANHGSDTSEVSASSPGVGPGVRETPTIGFAKNLFPFNGSSLFTSAN